LSTAKGNGHGHGPTAISPQVLPGAKPQRGSKQARGATPAAFRCGSNAISGKQIRQYFK
jgi:hypothetical protein